jgi:hypothetical protein
LALIWQIYEAIFDEDFHIHNFPEEANDCATDKTQSNLDNHSEQATVAEKFRWGGMLIY